MNRLGNLKKEICDLLDIGKKMYACFPIYSKSNYIHDLDYFLENYEIWYTKAFLLIKQVISDRIGDFSIQYINERRKNLSYSTYTISDALRLVTNKSANITPLCAARPLSSQIKMLESCSELLDSEINNIQRLLQADIFDSEIESSKHLLKRGFLRAAGAICGVILEKHFAEICKKRNISIKKKSPTIADFNDELKDNAYDLIEWRKIQHLADIRNLCDHNKDREPTKEEVEELINGADRVIKTIF